MNLRLAELKKNRGGVGFIHVCDYAFLSAVSILDYILMSSEQVM
jgi:hypothetical protein